MRSIIQHHHMKSSLQENITTHLFRMLFTYALGIQQYATNSLLYLRIIQDKYISLYRELITQLCTYVSAIRILAKGYLPNTLIKPKRLQEILTEVKKSLHNTNPDYNLVLDRLHLYYHMQFVTFGIDKDMNLIIQLPVFIQTIHSNTLNFIPVGDCTHSYFGQKYQSTIIHTFED